MAASFVLMFNGILRRLRGVVTAATGDTSLDGETSVELLQGPKADISGRIESGVGVAGLDATYGDGMLCFDQGSVSPWREISTSLGVAFCASKGMGIC